MIFGIVFIIIGVFMVYYGYSTVQTIESKNIYGLSLPEFFEADPQSQGEFIVANFIILVGVVVIIIGIVLCYISLFAVTKSGRIEFLGNASQSIQSRRPRGQLDDPIQILRIRYAKGEISREEFQRMKQDIEG
jgi:uncharacterized membrane protein